MTQHSEDLELVERMLAGDEAAFDAFAERCLKAAYRFALSRLRGDRDLAQEIVQTAAVKALAKLETYRGDASLATWLCACCNNEILMHSRRRRTAPAEVELGEEVEPSPDAEVRLLRQEEARRVHLALDGLPEHYAQALEWKYVERIPVNEIASRMGVQPKAAESLLTRARQAFRTSYASFSGGWKLLRGSPGGKGF